MLIHELITLAENVGYNYNQKFENYTQYVNEKLNLSIFIGNKDVELEGYPTALDYSIATNLRQLQAVEDFITGKITDDNFQTTSLYDIT